MKESEILFCVIEIQKQKKAAHNFAIALKRNPF